MENKKLLKFLFKDIAEVEELFIEKGSEGFDEYEIEFIQSRFKGAKQVIQILSEKEKKLVNRIRPRPLQEEGKSVEPQSNVVEPKEKKQSSPQLEDEPKGKIKLQSELKVEEKDSLKSLSEFEEELKEVEQPPMNEKVVEVEEEVSNVIVEESTKVQKEVIGEKEIEQPIEEELVAEKTEEVQLNEEEVKDEANHRLGDSFSKEKSVNEVLAGDSNKLEHKISNSPVASIKAAIGINDRYQYIRELFEGNADTFSKAVSELDELNSINEAVTYLQQNYKWKKNDTSLKFVSLIKRRFPNE